MHKTEDQLRDSQSITGFTTLRTVTVEEAKELLRETGLRSILQGARTLYDGERQVSEVQGRTDGKAQTV